jgi:hypothetical protein
MIELPALVKLLFFVTALCYAVLHAGGFAQTAETQPAIVAPADACPQLQSDPAYESCISGYLADLQYRAAIDPTRTAISAAFPVLAVVAAAYLAAKLGGL